jgi:putative membrane-bound dehydrogenase-like protein
VPPDLFTVPKGFEVTLWATSPLLFNPTNMDFDSQGRLYVAEGVNYRGKKGRRPEGDRVVVLEDTTGSGRSDKSSVFVQDTNLEAPLGVAVLDDKVVVSQPPDLLVYHDANRDGKFDPASEKVEAATVLHLHDRAESIFQRRREGRSRRPVGHPFSKHLHRRTERPQ